MHQDKAELYVRIVPFTNADHKRIQRNKNNPLQRIKVSNNTTLYTISSYIHGQASSSDQNQLSVSLHVPFSNKCVQLPLSMSVADFLLITNHICIANRSLNLMLVKEDFDYLLSIENLILIVHFLF